MKWIEMKWNEMKWNIILFWLKSILFLLKLIQVDSKGKGNNKLLNIYIKLQQSVNVLA